MQNYQKFVPTIIFLSIVHCAFSFQEPTRLKKDTLNEKTIQYAPYHSKEKVKSLGNYVGVVDDSLLFQFSSGISVLNTLRGQLPNAGVSPNAQFATARNSLFVIDGLPYQSAINSYYNMNAFDYSSIALLSRGNAASLFGGPGANGAFVLKSKTGENQFKPTVEFNSYSTLSWYEVGSFNNNDTETIKQWYLSNSAAYMQDFGKIDTRVSYNFLAVPSPSTGSDIHSNSHNFKINTGFDISPKFDARLILDNFYTKDNSSFPIFDPYQGLLVGAEYKTNKNFLQGNLILNYHPLNWLKITSQSALGKTGYESESSQQNTVQENNLDQDRFLSNLFVSVNKNILPQFSFTSFAGFQLENVKASSTRYRFQNQQLIAFGEEYVTIKTESMLGGLGLNYNDFLFINFKYRMDAANTTALPTNNQKPTYAFSTAFIFSDAFGWTSSFFSLGKIRGSIGKSNMVKDHPYPNAPSTTSLFVNPFGNSKNLFEIGTDLSFAKNRLLFTLNYFDEKSIDNYVLTPIPVSTGYSSQYVNVGTLRTKGTEIILKAIPIKRNKLEYQAILMWMTSKTKVESISGITTGTGTNDNVLGSVNPSWTGSVLNQIIWKNLVLSFLVDIRKGGSFRSWSQMPNNTYYFIDGSQMKLRDVSMGYRLGQSFLSKVGFRQAQVSVSARNTFLIYSKSDIDVEDGPSNVSPQKSASVSLSLLF